MIGDREGDPLLVGRTSGEPHAGRTSGEPRPPAVGPNPSTAGPSPSRSNDDQAEGHARLATLTLGTGSEALVDLTRIGQQSPSFDELARDTIRLVVEALGAAAGSYALIGPNDLLCNVQSLNLPEPFNSWPAEQPASTMESIRRFMQGEMAYFQPYEEGAVTAGSLESARKSGFTAYSSMPLRTDGSVDGLITVYFDRPLESISVNQVSLDAIARIASISLANFRLREELEASERRYRTLFDASPEAYLLCELDGTVLVANPAASRMFGRPDGELRGTRAPDLLLLDEAAEDTGLESLGLDTLGAGERATFTANGRRADTTTFPCESDVAGITIEGRDRLLVLVRDVTERNRLQHELVQAQKMETVGVLVSGIAHELNNPIQAIVVQAENMQRDQHLPEHYREDTGHLLEEADRARRIVQTFLDFIRSRPPERHPTPVLPLIETVRNLQAYSLRSGVEWQIDVEPDLPPVPIDRSQIQQVLLNLTTNAIQAMLADRATGTLEIRAVPGPPLDERQTVRITVTDDGPGISEASRSRLFIPFFTTKGPGEGTGLGLSVSHDIVRRHDGRLSYEPAPSGRGARFVIDLPTSSALERGRPDSVDPSPSDTARSGRPSPRPDGRPARVLVLDDEPAIRKFLGTAITRAGYEAVVVADGPTAIAEARAGPIDVVLVDHRMSGMSGIEVYEAVVAIRPELASRWVFMSGDVLNPALLDFAEAHRIRLLAKPFDLATVIATVALVIDPVGATD